MLGDELKQGLQVLEVEDHQAFIVGDLEGDVENALLGLVEIQQSRQQKRPHLRHGGADRMPLFPEQIPEDDRCCFGRVALQADLLDALEQLRLGDSGLGEAR